MTTTQIVIYSILFIIDLSITYDYVNNVDRDSDKQAGIFLLVY
jgi:hypothetical protein